MRKTGNRLLVTVRPYIFLPAYSGQEDVNVCPMKIQIGKQLKKKEKYAAEKEELRDIAYSIVGHPEEIQFEDQVVGIIESRDGTILDIVRKIKPYRFEESEEISGK